jgi:hypothetical protein
MRTIGRVLRRTRAAGIALAAGAAAVAAPASADTLIKTAFSGGAVDGQDAAFHLCATVGEAGVVGLGRSNYIVGQGFWAGQFRSAATDVAPVETGAAIQYVNGLRQNFPNPFGGSTAIAYTIGAPTAVSLMIYDVTGRRVTTLVDSERLPGSYRVPWDGTDGGGRRVAGGVYFVRLQVGSWSSTSKLSKLH